MRLFWVPGHSRICGNEIADELAIEGTVNQFVEPEPALGVSRQIIRKKIKGWFNNQHMAIWQGFVSTQRQVRKLISSPSSKSSIFTTLLTGHNTLRRDLYIMELIDIPLCRRCEGEEETSAHIFFVRVKPLIHSDTPNWVIFLGPRECYKSKSGGNLEL